MKIAVVVNCLKIGGMERVAVNLSDAFFEAGNDVELIYLKDRKREVEPRNRAIPIHAFNLRTNALKTGIGIVWFILCKILNQLSPKTYPIWFAYLEAQIFKYKLSVLEKQNGKFDLIIFRGQGTFEHLWPLHDDRFVYVCENIQKKHMYGKLSKWVFSKLFLRRNVVCVSEGAMSSFQDMIDTHKISPKSQYMISNPNDFRKIREDAEKTIKPLHNKPYILGLGRLAPQKNFTLLVDAYHQAITQHGITQDLVIVGSGRDKENIENKVDELGLQNRVHFKGQQNNPFPWYKQADLFVLSSKFEGLGMVLIESLACGTKVVSTNSKGGVKQIMRGELAPFLSDETPEDLSDKINLALNTPPSEHFNAYVQETLDRFDGKNIVKQYFTHFIDKK